MRITRVLWIIIGIIFLFWVYYLFISPVILKPKTTEVPDIYGMTEDNAIYTLEANSLSYKIHYIDGDSNTVKYSVPATGMIVYEGYEVEMYIEVPQPTCYPSFEGLLFNENKSLIDNFCTKNKISYDIEYVVDENGIDNQIIQQSKTNNDLVIEGDILLLKIVKTNSYFTMPNLMGLNVYDAIDLLSSYDIEYTIIYYNAPVLEDTVLSQEIEPGTVLKKKAKHILYLYVSKGMPKDISTINILDFCNILNDLSYNYDIIYVDSHIDDTLISIDYIANEYKYILYVSK